MIGGRRRRRDTARPLFDVARQTIVHVGPHGAGQTVKAANQLVSAASVPWSAGRRAAGRVPVSTSAPAWRYWPVAWPPTASGPEARVDLRRDFHPGAKIELHHKDMASSWTRPPRRRGPPGHRVVAQLMAAGRAMGFGAQDHTALVRVIEQLSGRTER